MPYHGKRTRRARAQAFRADVDGSGGRARRSVQRVRRALQAHRPTSDGRISCRPRECNGFRISREPGQARSGHRGTGSYHQAQGCRDCPVRSPGRPAHARALGSRSRDRQVEDEPASGRTRRRRMARSQACAGWARLVVVAVARLIGHRVSARPRPRGKRAARSTQGWARLPSNGTVRADTVGPHRRSRLSRCRSLSRSALAALLPLLVLLLHPRPDAAFHPGAGWDRLEQ